MGVALSALRRGADAVACEQAVALVLPDHNRRWHRSVVCEAQALVASRREQAAESAKGAKERLARLKKRIKKTEERTKRAAKQGRKPAPNTGRDRRGLEQRLYGLETRLEREQAVARGDLFPAITLGSKKLLRKRHTLAASGLSEDEWREQWRDARQTSLFLIGDRDRLGGNQNARIDLERELLVIGYGRQQTLSLPVSGLNERSRPLFAWAHERLPSPSGKQLLTRSPVTVRVYYR
ncbi:MAG: hypothetical protein ACRDHE_09405, partial [Ktedonobacterales bacterium]